MRSTTSQTLVVKYLAQSNPGITRPPERKVEVWSYAVGVSGA
jgi:hypothetical protein